VSLLAASLDAAEAGAVAAAGAACAGFDEGSVGGEGLAGCSRSKVVTAGSTMPAGALTCPADGKLGHPYQIAACSC